MTPSRVPGERVWVALYRRRLRARAPDVWRTHGADAVGVFEALLRDGWRRRGWWGVAQVVWTSSRGLGRGGDVDGTGRWVGTAVRQGGRALRRRPGFVATVVALLGVGIGAVTTLFSLVDGILLRPLAYADADRLVRFTEGSHTLPDMEDWREMASSFDLIAGMYTEVQALGDVEPVRIRMARLTDGFLEGLGATTAMGRLPTREELRTDAAVAVADHGFWQRFWGGDPAVVGRTVTLDGAPVTLVGVLSPAFPHPEGLSGIRPELWRPVPDDPEVLDRHSRRLSVYGRLRPGVPLEAAREEMDGIESELAARYPDLHADDAGRALRDFGPEPLGEATVGEARRPLLVLLAGTILLLFVACANAAGLVLAHGAGRRAELAVRGALGASRRHLFAQLLGESLAIAALGAAVGTGLAHLGLWWVRQADPGSLPLLGRVAIDLRVLGATAGLAVATGILFGLVPALQASRVLPGRVLRSAGARGGGAVHRVQAGLIVGEVAVSTVLLAGAGFLLGSFLDLTRVEPGFDPEPVMTVQVNFPPHLDADERTAVAEAMEARLARLPGVEAVGAGLNVPFDLIGGARCCWWGGLEVDGRRSEDLWVRPVTPGYFAALGMPIQGRGLTREDAQGADVPVVLNEPAVRAVFGEEPALGRTAFFEPNTARVVGVVEGTRYWGFDEEVEPAMYVSWAQLGTWGERLRFAVRVVPGTEGEVLQALRPALLEVDPSLTVDPPEPLTDRIALSLSRRAFYLQLAGAFAALTLLLAAAGLYGTLLHYVRQRRREMGIRLALGAAAGSVAGLVLRRGLGTVVAGVALGALAVAPVHRALGDLLHDPDASMALTVGAVVVSLLLVGAAATWLPARLAARSDPRNCLQAD